MEEEEECDDDSSGKGQSVLLYTIQERVRKREGRWRGREREVEGVRESDLWEAENSPTSYVTVARRMWTATVTT